MKRRLSSAEEDEGDDSQQQQPPYYLRNFCLVLEHSRSAAVAGLFDAAELDAFARFSKLSPPAQKIFVRLYLRKGPWFSVARDCAAAYADIGCDASAALAECEAAGLVRTAASVTRGNAAELLQLARLPRLLEVARVCGVRVSSSGVQKADVVALLVERVSARGAVQRTLDGGCQLLQMLGGAAGVPAVRITEADKEAFRRAFRIFTMSPSHGETTVILADLQILRFPEYVVDRETSPFHGSRAEMLAFEAACSVEARFEALMAEGRFGDAGKLVATAAAAKLSELPRKEPPFPSELVASLVLLSDDVKVVAPFVPRGSSSSSKDGPAASALERFSEGWVLSRVLHHGVDAFERQRLYHDAVQCLWLLLSLPFRVYHRADWIVRLSLDLEHLGHKESALAVAELGLSDPTIGDNTGGRISLQKRVLKLARPPLRWKTPVFPSLTLREAKTITLVAQHTGTPAAGGKSLFIDAATGDKCIVEELALRHYKNDGWEGLHTESGVFLVLFSLLLWDQIFVSGIAGAFLTPYQDAPLDFGTEEFFQCRRACVEERLQAIAKMDGPLLAADVLSSWETHKGVSCRSVHWEHEAYTPELLSVIANAFGGQQIAAILEMMARDGSSWRAGMPDLVLHQNARGKLAEVKGPRDRLSCKQEAWIERLLVAGCEVEVCKVKDL